MNIKSTIFRASMIVGTLISAASAIEDIHDYVLNSYRVSPSQEAQFTRDGKMSAFWDAWDSANKGGVISMDMIDLIPQLNSWIDGTNAFKDSADAQMMVRSAYGAEGLYLMFEVVDDIWATMGWTGNAIFFLLDTMSSEQIKHDTVPFYSSAMWSSITYSSVRYQMNISGANGVLPNSLNIYYFNTPGFTYATVTLSQTSNLFDGLDMDMVQMSANTRRVEWKIPWTWVGFASENNHEPVTEKRFAFTPTFHDEDSPSQTGLKFLTWKEKDPFHTCEDMIPPHLYCDAWGDILITGQSLPTVIQTRSSKPITRSSAPTPHSINLEFTPNHTASPRITSTNKNGSRSYWDLTGRKIRRIQ